jgi:O-antigen/teichoic acid export membrane protein
VFVPLENLVFSVVKIVLLVALVAASPRYGIFAAWTAALVVSVVPVNLLLYTRLLPRHRRRADARLRPPTRAQVARFVSADYVGALCWLASTALMPVIVVALAGATQNAYFSLAWMIALPLYTISASTGSSLVVTAAGDEARLATYARQVLVQTARLVLPIAVLLALAAPYVLRVVGADYADHASGTLALLALSAIPGMVNVLYVNVYRARRTMSAVMIAMGAEAILVVGLGVLLLDPIGIVGVGVAWLVAQSVVAAAQVLIEPRALWSRPEE